jgi:hypothetical protein
MASRIAAVQIHACIYLHVSSVGKRKVRASI